MKETEYTYLSAFIHITRAIISTVDIKEVLHQIVKSTCEITCSKGCSLVLLDEKAERLEIKSSYGLSDRYVQKGPLFAEKSLSDTLEGKSIIIEDATRDPRVQYPDEAKREGIASIVSVPVTLRDRIIGALRLYTAVPCRFTEDDIEFLTAIAVQSGLAIEHAMMYEHRKATYAKEVASSSTA